MFQPFGFGTVCQPQSDSVPSGVVCSNASGKVCRPVASTVKANSPLPTDSGLAASKLVQHHVVPRHQRVPVNGCGVRPRPRRTGQSYENGAKTRFSIAWFKFIVTKSDANNTFKIPWPNYFSDSIPARKA